MNKIPATPSGLSGWSPSSHGDMHADDIGRFYPDTGTALLDLVLMTRQTAHHVHSPSDSVYNSIPFFSF